MSKKEVGTMIVLLVTVGMAFSFGLVSRFVILRLPEQKALNTITLTAVIFIVGFFILLGWSSMGHYHTPVWNAMMGLAYGFLTYNLLSYIFRKEPSIRVLAGMKR